MHSEYTQCIFLNDKIHLGGGEKNGKIFISSSELDSWTVITTPTNYYGITSYQSKLVLVGGNVTSTDLITSKLWVRDEEELDWRSSLPQITEPSMPKV